MQPYRIFISTGEVSGDLQGALLTTALFHQAQALNLDLEVVALGGDRMAAAGAKLIGNTSTIGSVGLWESIPYVLPTWQIQRRAKRHLLAQPPDLVVMIDYLGPNVGLGVFLGQQLPDIPIFYYIAPQEWVWSLGEGKTTQIVSFAERILAVFPGEATYYQNKGAKVTWVGHPLLDAQQSWPDRATARQQLGIPPDQVAIALVPASRRQELKYLLPIMAEAAQQIQAHMPQVHFWLPLSLEVYRPEVEAAIAQYRLQATIVSSQESGPGSDPASGQSSCQKLGPASSQTQMAIAAADLAITKSGTVNLEIALHQVPQVVIYRVSRVTAWIAVNLLKFSIPFMSPPNLVLMEEIVPELLQDQATPERICQEALELLNAPERRQQVLEGYGRMVTALGTAGVCDRAAQEILNHLNYLNPLN
jgi:lipid-A-disaccharide synthase